MINLEIIVNSCDAYSDVWPPFFFALRENWQGPIPPIILNTESGEFALDGLDIRRPRQVIEDQGVPDDWGNRLVKALHEARSDYVFMVFDDHIVEKPIDVEAIADCIRKMESNSHICVYYFVNPLLPLQTSEGGQRFLQVCPRADYILNSAPGLWRKSDLLKFVRPGDNPWAWEFFGSSRLQRSRKKAFAPGPDSDAVFAYQFALGGAIYRGKWVARVIEPALLRYGLSLDLSLRGVIEPTPIPHTIAWRVRFLKAGIKMIGISALFMQIRAVVRSIGRRILKKFGRIGG